MGMKATEDMMKNMSPDMLSSMARASGMAGDQNFSKDADSLQRVAKQMSENPDMAKQMTEMIKNVSPEQMQNMMKLTQSMGGDGRGDDEGGMDPSALLNNPDSMKVTEDRLGAAEALVANGDDLAVGQLVRLLERGRLGSGLHLLVEVECHVRELLLDVAHDLALGGAH